MSWQTETLEYLATVSSGDSAPQGEEHFGETGKPFIRAGSLALLLNGATENDLEKIPDAVSKSRRMKLYPAGTVLFAKSGMSCTKGLVYQLRKPAHVVSHLATVICKDALDARFLLRWYQANTPARLIENDAYPSIKISKIRSEQIPLPPLAEQKRIAGILDAADALRAKRREALAQLDTLLQSTFLDMFGDPVTNPMGWERTSFGNLIASGPQNGIYKPSKLYGSGVRILRIDGFYDGVVTGLASLKRVHVSQKEVDTYGLSESDIVINRVNSRSYLGKCALVPGLDEPVIFESNMMRLSLDARRMLPRFATEFLQTPYVKNQILSACKDAVNQSSINQGDVKGFQVLVPPIGLQRRFAAIVESVDRQKARIRSHLAELDALFASLQSRAFSGTL